MKTSTLAKIAAALLGLGLMTSVSTPSFARNHWDNDSWRSRHCEYCRHHRCDWDDRLRCGFDWDDHWKDRHHDRDWWEKHRHDHDHDHDHGH